MRRATLAGLLLCGCSYPTGQGMYQVIDGFGGGFGVVSSSVLVNNTATPAQGATNVDLATDIILVFSDFPDPATAVFPNLQIQSGANTFDFSSRVDLVNKSVVLTPKTTGDGGTSNLTPQAQYVVTVTPMVTSLSKMVADAAMVQFTTGMIPGNGPAPPPTKSFATDLAPVMIDPMLRTGSCSQVGCHASQAGDMKLIPMGAFDCTDEMTCYSNLVGQASVQDPQLSRVKPGDPANSYVLRKLVGTPDIPFPFAPMPLAGWGTNPAAATFNQTFSDWILGGANK